MQLEQLIAGAAVAGLGEELVVTNPSSEDALATIRTASADQVDAAVAAAARGFDQWRRTPASERCDLLHEAAAALKARTEEIALVMTLEGGKPLLENRDEIGWCVAALDFYAEIARASEGTVIPPVESSQMALVLKEPLGVVAAIVPWNYPLLLLFWKAAPALAAGNSVIVKPSELTPLATLKAVSECFEHLPTGVLQVLTGGGDVGRRLVEHRDVQMVAFTGSTPTGQWIARTAADTMKRVNLEMGGKDAFIVCDDIADVDTAARAGVWAACLNAGQVCTSAERFYVLDGVWDEYLERFVHHAKAVRLGDPLADGTDMGPMISAPQRAKVERQVADAVAAGGELIAGGGRGAMARGFYHEPTVLVGVPEDADLLVEETFGPVAPLVRVGSLDEAIAKANASRFGLGANVYTQRLDYAMTAVRELRAGTVWVNDPLTDNDAGPFGGYKMSGLGRELGAEGLEAFRETKHAHIDFLAEPKSWWYPYGGGQ